MLNEDLPPPFSMVAKSLMDGACLVVRPWFQSPGLGEVVTAYHLITWEVEAEGSELKVILD